MFINYSFDKEFMAVIPTIEQFSAQGSDGSVVNVIIGLVLAITFSYILGKIYVKYGTSLSNREKFSKNFVLLSMITTLVISVVKSSLALSLGLVGALSIVRFRAAIKEPEELVYLFLVIGVGLGLGAGQWLITTVAFIFMISVIIVRGYSKNETVKNISLMINFPTPKENSLSKIKQILLKNCKRVNLKRYDENDKGLEALFLIEFANSKSLENINNELKSLSGSAQISFLDNIV